MGPMRCTGCGELADTSIRDPFNLPLRQKVRTHISAMGGLMCCTDRPENLAMQHAAAPEMYVRSWSLICTRTGALHRHPAYSRRVRSHPTNIQSSSPQHCTTTSPCVLSPSAPNFPPRQPSLFLFFIYFQNTETPHNPLSQSFTRGEGRQLCVPRPCSPFGEVQGR